MESEELRVGGCRVQCSGPRAGREVLLVHGGPGAPGSLGAVARGLEDRFRVIEPWQRGSGSVALGVARHVEDLLRVVSECCRSARPTLIGHSWGAMLALAAAAERPERIGRLVLVGCGTFDEPSRALFRAQVAARSRALGIDLDGDPAQDEDARFRRQARLVDRLYAFDALDDQGTWTLDAPLDAPGSRETWADMLRLQADGTYPAAFGGIRAPVLMLHGREDPHPGPAVRDSLRPLLPQLEYRELPKCGHSPWLERQARAPFFKELRSYLAGPAFG